MCISHYRVTCNYSCIFDILSLTTVFLCYCKSPSFPILPQGNKTWTATVNIVQGVNSSGLFSLLLSYKSSLSVRALISVESTMAPVILSNCSQQCFFNLSTLFGEMSLTGSVMVNVTYEASVNHFTPTKVVALPQEFYQPLLLGNSSGDFLANCSITDNNMGYGTDHQALFCRAQVFSLTVNYLGGALREFVLLFFLLTINLSFVISPFTIPVLTGIAPNCNPFSK